MQKPVDDSATPETAPELAAPTIHETKDPSRALRPRLSFGLALPFAIVGAAGGWLSAGFLSNPIVHLTVGDDRALAASCAGAVAALVGAAITRWCVGGELGRAVLWGRLAGTVLLGGALSGAAVGAISVTTLFGIGTGALNGLLSSIAFLPVCALVLAAARRAERARMGSIVAGADRRAVWAILAAALAVTTLAALPDWPVSIEPTVLDAPIAAVALACVAGALVIGALAADLVAFARISRAARDPRMETRDPDDARRAPHLPRLDLGLGDDVRARLSRNATAYRSADRAVALLVGSEAQARAALGRAALRGLASAALVGGVLAAHASAAGTLGSFHHASLMCDRGHPSACRTAAILGRIRATSPDDLTRSVELHARACDGGEVMSCAELARIYEEGDGVRASPEASMTYRRRACEHGHVASCQAAFSTLARGDSLRQNLPLAASLLSRACRIGDKPSCTLAAFLDEAGSTAGALGRDDVACVRGSPAACETAAASHDRTLDYRQARLLREHADALARADRTAALR